MQGRVLAVSLLLLTGFGCTSDSADRPGSSEEADPRPPPKLIYVVEPNPVKPGGEMHAMLRNEGPGSIEYGNGWMIERWKKDRWIELRSPDLCAWTGEGYTMGPGDSDVEEVGGFGPNCFSHAPDDPGLYRVLKEVWQVGANPARGEVIALEARFRVTR